MLKQLDYSPLFSTRDSRIGCASVVYCESVNLIGYITVELIVYRKIVACMIVYVTLFQTDET